MKFEQMFLLYCGLSFLLVVIFCSHIVSDTVFILKVYYSYESEGAGGLVILKQEL